jgi:Sap, sulfolipid-1-addressing protein
VGWVDAELVLVSLAAMLSPTTLTFSVLSVVLSEKPLRTAILFYLGAVTATLAIGVIAAVVLGDALADRAPSTPKTWVAVLDVIVAVLLLGVVVWALRRPPNPERTASAVAQMGRVASSRAIAVVGAGAMLANPGAFIPIALKTISELDPSPTQYVADWIFFTVLAVLPLLVAIVALIVRRAWAERMLDAARTWLETHARTVAAAIVVLLALSLLRNGIAGLAG